MKNIKQKLKEKKGISTLEFAVSLLVFIMIFSFLFDFFFIAYRQHQVSRITSDLVREIAIQSGLESTTPSNYPGGPDNYVTVSEAYNALSKQMQDLGVTNFSAKVTMENRGNGTNYISFDLSPGESGYRTDYRGEISLEVHYTHKWGAWRSFIPFIQDAERTITRVGYGEYKYDYSNWKGEF